MCYWMREAMISEVARVNPTGFEDRRLHLLPPVKKNLSYFIALIIYFFYRNVKE